jgi:hypothetical protein
MIQVWDNCTAAQAMAKAELAEKGFLAPGTNVINGSVRIKVRSTEP